MKSIGLELPKDHNTRVKNKIFKFGDLLLRKLEATRNRESRGKLAPK
jgi:hypothetical protein